MHAAACHQVGVNFFPLAVEVLGGWSPPAVSIICSIGRRASQSLFGEKSRHRIIVDDTTVLVSEIVPVTGSLFVFPETSSDSENDTFPPFASVKEEIDSSDSERDTFPSFLNVKEEKKSLLKNPLALSSYSSSEDVFSMDSTSSKLPKHYYKFAEEQLQ
uniref:Uncharacterized protein n=1 Tax=Amphimedon queenslandica TaxID=400682 RepID=A0A1X7TXZ8_AMPQE